MRFYILFVGGVFSVKMLMWDQQLQWLVCAAKKIQFSAEKNQFNIEKFQFSVENIQFNHKKFQFSVENIQFSAKKFQFRAKKNQN